MTERYNSDLYHASVHSCEFRMSRAADSVIVCCTSASAGWLGNAGTHTQPTDTTAEAAAYSNASSDRRGRRAACASMR